MAKSKKKAEKEKKGGCLAEIGKWIIFIIIGLLSFIVANIKFIIVGWIGYKFIRKAKTVEILTPSKRKFYKVMGSLVIAGSVFWFIYERAIPKHLPPIAEKSFITTKYVELADKCEQQHAGLPVAAQLCKDEHLSKYKLKKVELVPGEEVKILNSLTWIGMYKVERADGNIFYLRDHLIADEGTLGLISPPINIFSSFVLPLWLIGEIGQGQVKFFDIIFRSPPMLLEHGIYMTDEIDDKSIQIYPTRLNRNLTGKSSAKYRKNERHPSKYSRFDHEAELLYSKLSEPVIVNGIPCNYAMKIELAYYSDGKRIVGDHIDGLSGGYIVTSNRSFVCTNGKVWRWIKN